MAADADDLRLGIGACLGAAAALAMSGLGTAYLSKQAERCEALSELQKAMMADLSESTHGRMVYWVSWLIAAVNSFAPLVISLFIIAPLGLAHAGITFFVLPLIATIGLAFLVIFLLVVFLGQFGQTF